MLVAALPVRDLYCWLRELPVRPWEYLVLLDNLILLQYLILMQLMVLLILRQLMVLLVLKQALVLLTEVCNRWKS